MQMSLFLCLIASIVTEDKYVVAKLPPSALAEGGKPGDDYWARPWASGGQGGGTKRPQTTKSTGRIVDTVLRGAFDLFGR